MIQPTRTTEIQFTSTPADVVAADSFGRKLRIHYPVNDLTREDRSLLAAAYQLMFADALGGNEDARDGFDDPFWKEYAEVFLGGCDRVARAFRTQRTKRRPRRIIPLHQ